MDDTRSFLHPSDVICMSLRVLFYGEWCYKRDASSGRCLHLVNNSSNAAEDRKDVSRGKKKMYKTESKEL